MLFQLLIFNVLNVLFDSLSSFSQCLLHVVVKTWCLFPSFHGRGCTFQRGWRSIRREEAWTVLCIEVSGCCERAPLPCKASKFGIKMIKMISNWSWLLRDSSCSDAKPSLEEALQMCSGTLWLANSDTFGYFWILLESWANVWQFCYVMSWNSARLHLAADFFSSLFGYGMCPLSPPQLSRALRRLYLPKRLKPSAREGRLHPAVVKELKYQLRITFHMALLAIFLGKKYDKTIKQRFFFLGFPMYFQTNPYPTLTSSCASLRHIFSTGLRFLTLKSLWRRGYVGIGQSPIILPSGYLMMLDDG